MTDNPVTISRFTLLSWATNTGGRILCPLGGSCTADAAVPILVMHGYASAGGRGLRQALTPQAQRALIRSGSKRAEALEALTAQVAELQQNLQVSSSPPAPLFPPPPPPPPLNSPLDPAAFCALCRMAAANPRSN